MIDLMCYKFQQKIIDIFNSQENIPFILKYYLFKDIWETIEQTKVSNDIQIRSLEKSQKKELVAEIPISNDFSQKNDQEQKEQ